MPFHIAITTYLTCSSAACVNICPARLRYEGHVTWLRQKLVNLGERWRNRPRNPAFVALANIAKDYFVQRCGKDGACQLEGVSYRPAEVNADTDSCRCILVIRRRVRAGRTCGIQRSKFASEWLFSDSSGFVCVLTEASWEMKHTHVDLVRREGEACCHLLYPSCFLIPQFTRCCFVENRLFMIAERNASS